MATLDKVWARFDSDSMGIVEGTDREIYVLWSLSKDDYKNHAKEIKSYKVEWFYFAGDTTAKRDLAIWLNGSSSSIEFQKTIDDQGNYYQVTSYTPPENARVVKVRIKPESKDKETKTNNGKTTTKGPYFTGVSKTAEYDIIDQTHPDAPEVPEVPDVSIEGTTLLAQLNNYDEKAKCIQFQIVANNNKVVHEQTVRIRTNRAAIKYTVAIGSKYKVRARASKLSGMSSYTVDPIDITATMSWADSVAAITRQVQKVTFANEANAVTNTMFESPVYTSAWSEYSDNVETIPADVNEKKVKAKAMTFGNLSGVKVTWAEAKNADSYEVEYATNPDFFDTSPGNVESVEVTTTEAIITGLDGGVTWYFRVRAKNDQGTSAWTKTYASAKVGTRPTAPTTWTITSTIKVGTNPTIYWTHNSEDGSDQTDVEVGVKVDNYEEVILYPLDKAANYYTIDILSAYWTLPINDGTKIAWRVRTKGILDQFSPWSATKTIEVYSPPQLTCSLSYGSNLGDDTESPFIMGYYPLNIELEATPANRSVVSFSVSITANKEYTDIDEIGNTITVRKGEELYHKVFNHVSNDDNLGRLKLTPGDINLKSDGVIGYTITATAAMSSGLTAKATRTFKLIYSIDEKFYTCDAEVRIRPGTLTAEIVPVAKDAYNNVKKSRYLKLSVYRREYNGTFTLIDSDIDTEDYPVAITDPHPSLHYAAYRVVAISTRTGAVSFGDTQPIPILYNSIVIQWDEAWQTFYDAVEDGTVMDISTWEGSTLMLPYNVDITAEQKNDVELVGYIGREHPVSYYGTQKSETGHWKAEIPKRDTATLYSLRRLANYMGNAYVREPSGLGYWAHVDVSYNIDHVKTVVPVTLTITRVEGGV